MLVDHMTTEMLVPPFGSKDRHSTLVPATFNLVATIIGAGVLSLPLAFEKCGVILATILMIFAAVITDFSLYLLCISARQTGASSYGEVGRRAFGKRCEWFISGLLFVFLLFIVVAFMILVTDVWTPIVGLAFSTDAQPTRRTVSLVVVLFMTPFLIQRDLHSLRYNCYVGFASCAILLCALCHRAWLNQLGSIEKVSMDPIRYVASDLGDVLFAFPIITLAFLSQFNILPIQSALIEPTKARLCKMISVAISASGFIMYFLGLAGYLAFGSATDGNILLNLSNDKHILVFAGRVGYGITISLAVPMMVFPCRSSILELIDCWFEQYYESGPKQQPSEELVVAQEETALLPIMDHAPIENLNASEKRVHASKNRWGHYGSTFLIVGACTYCSLEVSGVVIVLSFCGSSMAFMIGFILPPACYLKIQRDRPQYSASQKKTIAASWVLLFFGLSATMACTTHQILSNFGSDR